MDAMSSTAVMSASQRAKKVSQPDVKSIGPWVSEVIETLNTRAGVVKVASKYLKDIQEQLSDMQEAGQEVDPHELQTLVKLLGEDDTACGRLKPDAFSLLVDVLLETSESDIRARGLYVLAESLQREGLETRRQDLFDNRRDLIGQGCLLRLYDQFTEKSVSYNSRRWMGALLLELTREHEENQQIVAMMSTSKRSKLGTCILYEASEILRSISGRIITVMLAAEHPIKHFFPLGTAQKLLDTYPGSTQSASQWDKTFQTYIDEIWPDISADNESSGELQFAINIAIEPPQPHIRGMTLGHRSIYIELIDTVRLYIHAGKENFDSAIDVPFASIVDISTELTHVDRQQAIHPVDVVITIASSSYCLVNSLPTSLSAVRLTVQDQSMADGIVDGIGGLLLQSDETERAELQVPPSSSDTTDSQGSNRSRRSCGDETLVLDGSYSPTVINDSFVRAPIAVTSAKGAQNEEYIGSHIAKQDSKLYKKPKQGKSPTLAAAEGVKSAAIAARKRDPKNTIEVDVVRDVEAGEVVSSNVLGTSAIDSQRPEREGQRSSPQPAHAVSDSSDQITGSLPNYLSEVPEETPPVEEKHNQTLGALSHHKRVALKSKTPVQPQKPLGKKADEHEQSPIQVAKPSSLKGKDAVSSTPGSEVPKSKLVHPSKTANKGTGKFGAMKGAVKSDTNEGDIFDVSSSPGPKVIANVAGKRKQAAPSAKSSRKYGTKTKAQGKGLISAVQEPDTITVPDLSFPKVKKVAARKKPAKEARLEPTTTAASHGKRITAPRSTKVNKNMKDLSDSDYDEDDSRVEHSAPKSHTIGVTGTQGLTISKLSAAKVKKITKAVPTTEPMPSEAVARAPRSQVKANKDAISKSIVREKTVVNETTEFLPLVDSYDELPRMSEWGPFGDATVAAMIAESDGLDRTLPPTAESEKPAVTVESKIARKLAEILGFQPVEAPLGGKKKSYEAELPQEPEKHPSSSVIEAGRYSRGLLEETHAEKPLMKSSAHVRAMVEDDEFFALSSPLDLIDEASKKRLTNVATQSTAVASAIVLSSDSEGHLPPVKDKKKGEKRATLAQLADNTPKRQRLQKPAVTSSPAHPDATQLANRDATKAKPQSREHVTPAPNRNPSGAGQSPDGPLIDLSTLIDDHQARKTPLIAFGPQGPRNQGLASAVKPMKYKEQHTPNTLTAILHNLSNATGEKSGENTEQVLVIATPPSIEVDSESVEDSLGLFQDVAENIHDGQGGKETAFLDNEESVTSSRSQSRVNMNGSPQPRRTPSAPKIGTTNALRSQVIDPALASEKARPRKEAMLLGERRRKEADFGDDSTLFGSPLVISSNRKARPAAPQDDLDFEKRYAPHHPAENGAYIGVSNQKVIDVAPRGNDPFTNKKTREDSDFSRRLRNSAGRKIATPVQQADLAANMAGLGANITARNPPHPSHKSLAIDPDATLVEAAKRPVSQKRVICRYDRTSDSSDTDADTSQEKDEQQELTNQQLWREALKPHQQDVSDVLHHVVDGLLQQLFDKEPAVYAIADEYRTNGTKIVEGLKVEMESDVHALNTQTLNTIQELAASTRQLRAEISSSSGGGKELDDQYKEWRIRQHGLQSLPFMARENGR